MGCKVDRFKAGRYILFFDNHPVPRVSGKAIPCWTGPHRVLSMEDPQQHKLIEVKTRRVFPAHQSRMKKTTLEQLAEDCWRTVLLKPGQMLEDTRDYTIFSKTTDRGSNQRNQICDEILLEKYTEVEGEPR